MVSFLAYVYICGIIKSGKGKAGYAMKIKDIKSLYNRKYGHGEKTMFVTYDYNDGNGKVVIVVTKCRSYGETVWQAVRVNDGMELIPDGDCRPCENLDDAIDVAGEMMVN